MKSIYLYSLLVQKKNCYQDFGGAVQRVRETIEPGTNAGQPTVVDIAENDYKLVVRKYS